MWKWKKNHKTKKKVYTTCHGLMLPIMVEIPGGRIIYPNGITANGVHDPIPFWQTVCIPDMGFSSLATGKDIQHS